MAIRPLTFDGFTGQGNVVKQLKIAVKASLIRDEAMMHCAFAGPPGLGKTTLANIIANELDGKLVTAIASCIKTPDDLLGLFQQIDRPNTVIFLDEVEKLKRNLTELLHTALEDRTLTIRRKTSVGEVIDTIKLPPFTMVCATNYLGELPRPFLDRFGLKFTFEEYSANEIESVLINYGKKARVPFSRGAVKKLAAVSRGVPRIAISLFERASDLALAEPVEYHKNRSVINTKVVENTLELAGIGPLGLNRLDYKILKYLNTAGRAVGISTISSAVYEEAVSVEMAEEYLIREVLIIRTPSGRIITDKGKQFLAQYKKELS